MKQLLTVDDLAIFGAPPMFRDPLCVGRPNVGNRHELFRRIGDILDSRWFTNNGRYVREFEDRLKQFLGVRHCIPICNGTVALEIAIRALDLKGEVLMPSFTFIATAHALKWQGITPVFCDIDPVTYNIDPSRIEELITPKTTGILGVHIWGRACEIERLQAIADRRGLALMFDAAHALGCSSKGRRIGNFGQCEVFSFHATKFFNTFEGGAIATNDDRLASRIRLMKNFGFADYDKVVCLGTNGKMSEVCAAMGLTQLDDLATFTSVNKRHFDHYDRGLTHDTSSVSLIHPPIGEETNWQYVVVRVRPNSPLSRDELLRVLQTENVLARRYFWPGCHRMEPYATLHPEASQRLHVTGTLSEEVLVLPTGTAVTDDDVDGVIAIIRLALSAGTRVRHHLRERS